MTANTRKVKTQKGILLIILNTNTVRIVEEGDFPSKFLTMNYRGAIPPGEPPKLENAKFRLPKVGEVVVTSAFLSGVVYFSSPVMGIIEQQAVPSRRRKKS